MAGRELGLEGYVGEGFPRDRKRGKDLGDECGQRGGGGGGGGTGIKGSDQETLSALRTEAVAAPRVGVGLGGKRWIQPEHRKQKQQKGGSRGTGTVWNSSSGRDRWAPCREGAGGHGGPFQRTRDPETQPADQGLNLVRLLLHSRQQELQARTWEGEATLWSA